MQRRTGWSILVFLATAFLIFWNLGHYAPWDDEATTAQLGRAVWSKGEAYVYDGRNLVAYQNGILVKRGINMGDPPLQFFLVAPFVGIGGNNMWAARLPFALCGLACVGVLLLWLHRDCKDPITSTLFALGILTSTAMWLYFRQTRYYAPAIFLSVLIAYLYVHFDGKTWKLIVMALAMALLMLDHYLNYLALCGCLVLDYVVWQRKSTPLRLRHWIFLLVPQLIAAGWIILWRLPPATAALASHQGKNSPLEKLVLFLFELRDANTDELMPVIFIPVAIAWALLKRPAWVGRAVTCWLVYLAMIALTAPTSVAKDLQSETRYLAPTIPLGIAIVVLVIRGLWQRWPRAGVVVAIMAFATTSLHLLVPTRPGQVFPMRARSTFASYLGELAHPPTDPYRAAATWIAANVAPGESIYTLPLHAEYPLLFLRPEAIYAWQLWGDALPPIANLPDIHFRERVAPDYVIFFGRDPDLTRVWDPRIRKLADYIQVATLDVYCRDHFRPEIGWHLFSAAEGYDPETETIAIWKKMDSPASTSPATAPTR